MNYSNEIKIPKSIKNYKIKQKTKNLPTAINLSQQQERSNIP